MFLIVLIVIIGIVFGSLCAVYQPSDYQKEMLANLVTVQDNLYCLDYTYDYDIDDLMERGVSSVTDMIEYATKHIIKDNDEQFELNIQEGACSVFNAITEDGDKIFARNFDYYESPVFMVWLHPSNGYASINTVNGNFLLYTSSILPTESNRNKLLLSPYVCMDGMNEKGLAIAILELDYEPTNQDNGKTDMTTSCMVRCVLDKCATVEEAIAMFERFDMHDLIGCGYHYQVTDATGKSVLIEYDVDNVMHVYDSSCSNPEATDRGADCYNYQYMTNYYITYDKDHYAQEDCFGWDRTEKINAKLSSTKGVLSETDAMQLLSDVKLNEYMDGALFKVVTVWSSIFNQTDLTVNVSVAMDYTKTFTFKLSEPCKVY